MSTSPPQQPLPTSQVAWQVASPPSTMEQGLKLNQVAPVPKLKANQTLIKVLSTSLNPVDYKIAELPLAARLMISWPHTPGMDYVGRVWQTTLADSEGIQAGDMVYGTIGAPIGLKHGTLGQFALISGSKGITKVPTQTPNQAGDLDDYSAIGIAGLTAYQSLQTEFGKPASQGGRGKTVFINGGSGGTGTFGIQLAKHVYGCDKVIASCSGANAELCRNLGADHVIDYKQGPVAKQLREWLKQNNNGQGVDLVIDNVTIDADLYWQMQDCIKAGKRYTQVGGSPGLGVTVNMFKILLWPGFLGGGTRKWAFIAAQTKREDLAELGQWIAEGKIKPVIAQTLEMEQAPKAFELLRSGRTKGKIVVRVSEDGR